MAQLGSRMFFLVMDAAAEPTVEDLVSANLQPVVYEEGISRCRAVIHPFLDSLFTSHGSIRGMHWNPEENPPDVLTSIAQCAKLLAVLRTPYERDNTSLPESPHRANAVLYNLARGHALICGRTQLAIEDLPTVAQVTLSSIPFRRRAVLQLMAEQDGKPVTVSQVEKATNVTRHTAEEIMREMDALGLMEFQSEGAGKAASLAMNSEWAWCMTERFRALLLGSDLAV